MTTIHPFIDVCSSSQKALKALEAIHPIWTAPYRNELVTTTGGIEAWTADGPAGAGNRVAAGRFHFMRLPYIEITSATEAADLANAMGMRRGKFGAAMENNGRLFAVPIDTALAAIVLSRGQRATALRVALGLPPKITPRHLLGQIEVAIATGRPYSSWSMPNMPKVQPVKADSPLDQLMRAANAAEADALARYEAAFEALDTASIALEAARTHALKVSRVASELDRLQETTSLATAAPY